MKYYLEITLHEEDASGDIQEFEGNQWIASSKERALNAFSYLSGVAAELTVPLNTRTKTWANLSPAEQETVLYAEQGRKGRGREPQPSRFSGWTETRQGQEASRELESPIAPRPSTPQD